MTQPHFTASGATRAEALLDQLVETALDDDYFHSGRPAHPGRARLVTTAIVLLFGVVLSVAALQAANERPGAKVERKALVDDIRQRQELAASRRRVVSDLSSQIAQLRAKSGATTTQSAAAELATGSSAVTGPGLKITARSSSAADGVDISDTDLQLLVNGLWYAGAEAIAINGERLGPTTAIRIAGQAVTVNYRALTEPYVVSAIGNSDMAERWSDGPSGRFWSALRASTGATYTVSRVRDDLTLPAVPSSRLTIRHTTISSARGSK